MNGIPVPLFERIYETATLAVQKFTELFPEEQRTGGWLGIGAREGNILHRAQIGEVPKDKADRYHRLAGEKIERLGRHPEHQTSRESRNPDADEWGGAVRAADLIFSFSGLPELGDEAVALVLAVEITNLPIGEAMHRAKGNHYFLPLWEAVHRELVRHGEERRQRNAEEVIGLLKRTAERAVKQSSRHRFHLPLGNLPLSHWETVAVQRVLEAEFAEAEEPALLAALDQFMHAPNDTDEREKLRTLYEQLLLKHPRPRS
ncbi:MAG: hypothetical protein HYZ09_03595 [Candidatus Kerfeldbacteria bacterium]|nr:hypothetical protein [Candidatus Kerfeldbacteria bacterium]